MESTPRWLAALGLLAVATVTLLASAQPGKGHDTSRSATSASRPRASTVGRADVAPRPGNTSAEAQGLGKAPAGAPPAKTPKAAEHDPGRVSPTAKGHSSASKGAGPPSRGEATPGDRGHRAAQDHAAFAAKPGSKSELRRHRKKRRRAAVRALRQRWGERVLMEPPGRAAVKVHSWRMARLHRIRELLDMKADAKTLAKVDALTDKEQARFRKQMELLKQAGQTDKQGPPPPKDEGSSAREPRAPRAHAESEPASPSKSEPPAAGKASGPAAQEPSP